MQAERVIFTVFTSADYVKKLVSFLSLEENKGKDQYSDGHFIMFKVRKPELYTCYTSRQRASETPLHSSFTSYIHTYMVLLLYLLYVLL